MYSVVQILLCTTPVLPCTTEYYSSTTLYYSSTTLYYKVLLQYYPVLQSTSWLIRITYETSFTMRGATKGSLQLQQKLRLPRKMNLMIDLHRIWNVIYNARSNRHHPPTSPNTAPAKQNESHDWSTSHMKRHLQCAEQQSTPSNLTKYCACHAKWISWLIHITYETSFAMCGATVNTLQPHQILRLPRKIALPNLREIYWKQVKWHFQCATDPSMIRPWSEHDPTQKTQTATRRATEATFRTRQEQILLKIATFPAPAIIPNFTTCCACHEKWHMNFTKCCTCHEKWHMNFTKCCTCHKKWHMNFTKCCTCHEKWHMLHLPQKVKHELHQMLHLPRKVTHELHQMLHLPRQRSVMIDLHHIWNVIYNARSNSQHPPTSPNTAPATRNCTPKS